jgi:hypothetical protein
MDAQKTDEVPESRAAGSSVARRWVHIVGNGEKLERIFCLVGFSRIARPAHKARIM